MKRNIAFLDIETTGLDSRRDEILEVAFIVRPQNPSFPEHEVYFSLPFNAAAHTKALEVNRYYEREEQLMRSRIDRFAACEILCAELKDTLIVGNNVAFDLRFLGELIGREPWFYQPLDLKAYAAGMCGKSEPVTTKFLAELAEVPLPDDMHTAMADARWNRDVYNELSGKFA